MLVSCDEWQPLQVFSANLWRASGLVIPGAHQELRSLKTAPARKAGHAPSWKVSGTSCRSIRMASSLALTKLASSWRAIERRPVGRQLDRCRAPACRPRSG